MSEPGQLVRSTDIPVAVGHPNAETQRKWLSAQVPYKNYAGVSDEVDRKAEQWVTNYRERFHARMGGTMQRWALNWSAANGESLWQEYDDDVHVPETKKALDAKVARIEEAIFEFDPVFETQGTRGDLPQWKAQIIQAAVHRSMDLAGYRDFVQPVARDMELCNVAALKVEWEQLYEWIVERKSELRFRDDGQPYRHDERRMRQALAKSGVRYRQVDPFLFIYDMDVGRAEDSAYMGDESDQYAHEIEARVKSGFFSKKNWDLLKKRQAGIRTDGATVAATGATFADQLRQARSIAMGPGSATDEEGALGAKRLRAIEMWGWFDFGDGFAGVVDPLGRKVTGYQRVVATVISGVVMRFMLNPFDRKFAPYAVGRINRNGHEMVAPATFDTVVQTNAQYDRVQSNVLRWLDCVVSPKIIAQEGSNLPDTILGDKPGTIYRSNGSWDVLKMPDISQSISYFHQYFRREIEEDSGALRVFESPQGTATETERKVQEQQRMVRTSIRANAELWRQLAKQTYWMLGQFMTQPERFAVVGKGAAVLNKSVMVTPDILQEDVDFRFLGLDSLHVFGNRQAGITQYMNRWGPMMREIPGLNIPGLARMDFELTVGRHSINEIFSDPEPPWHSWPQVEENEMLLAGREVPVSKHDNDAEHIEQLLPLLDTSVPAYVRQLAVDHLMAHEESMARKQAEQQAAQKQAEQQQALLGGTPGVDKAPERGGMAAKPQGTTPGPTQARTVSRTGRSGQGISQSQEMSA